MKTIKLVVILFIVTASTASFSQTKDLKIGHINSNDLLGLMPERAGLQKQIEDHAAQLTATMDAMRKEYETKVGDFQSKQDVMTDVIKEAKVKEITDLEKRIGEFQQTAQSDLQKKEQDLLQPIIDKAKEAIESVGKEGGYTYILDSSLGVVLYSAPNAEDILPKVKKKLGLQ